MRCVLPARSWRAVPAAAVALLAAAAAGPAAAQDVRPLTDPPAFRIDQWTTEDGLPQNSVNAIVQAPDGHLWIGTFGGLVRFDGSTFWLVERADSAGRHVDRILALAVGPDTTLWIGTEQGLFSYRDGTFRRFTTSDGLPHDMVPALYVDRSGIVWVGGQEGGVARFDGMGFTRFAEVDGGPFDHVLSFRESADGTLWINTGSRFITMEDGSPTRRHWRTRPPGAMHFALEDRAGARWFTRARGLTRLAGGDARVFGVGTGVPGASLMVEDPAGGYWIGTDNDGLMYFDPAAGGDPGVRQYPLPDGRLQYRVRTAMVDVEGNMWVGTNANGLLRAKRNVFTTYTSAHGLSHDVATAVMVDAAGVIWAATNCWGVNVIDPVRRTVQVFKPRLPADPAGDPCVFSLAESRPGTMWIGTWGGGLTRVQDGREDWQRYNTGLRDSVILALFTDRAGTVWVGTNGGGLASLEGTRVDRVYTADDGLAHNSVRSIYQADDGALWVGTLEGLSRFADGRFTTYRAADGLSAEHVRALYEDADGNLWVGTYGGGLNRFRDGVFTAITRREGLADDVVSAILEDDRGHFWMSGNRGIYRVPRADLLAVANGERTRVHSVLYGEADGLLSAETNGGFQPAAWKDPAGRLWFPTVQGLAVVNPRRVTAMNRPPPVRIEEVVVDGVSRPATGALTVGPGRPNVEFRYTGLSLSAPEHLTFRYRLDGFDPDWVEADVRRVAYYPRLPPGRYRFRVMAANRDGVWNAADADIALRVATPVWAAWWFRAALATVVLGLVGTALWRREVAARRQQAAREEFSRLLIESQEHERKRVAGELHDGLGQDLLVVRNRALLAMRDAGLGERPRDQLQQITDIATRSLETVRGLAHNLTPYQLDHLGLTAAVRAMTEAVAGATDLRVDLAIDDIDGLMPVAGEINLYRIVQEALSNVVHHGQACHVSVRIRRERDTIRVCIADDGRGFTVRRDREGQPAGGFGLSGIAERARILGGRVHVTSTPRQGTRVDLTVPVPGAGRAS